MDTVLAVGLGNAVAAGGLALAAAAVTYLGGRPALAHALWVLVLLKLVTPPVVRIPLPAPAPARVGAPVADAPPGPGRPAGPPVEAVDPGPAAGPWAVPWRQALAAGWLGGAAVWWAVAGWRARRFGRLLRLAVPAPPAVRERAERLAARVGLARCPAVGLLPAAIPPLVWAPPGGPRVVLPAGLWDALTEEQQDTLLVHELAHLRRRDHWVRWLELAAGGLYWWHPAAWWARREVQEAQERCCDGWVVRVLPGAAYAYAQALVQTVAFLSRPQPALPAAATGMGHVQDLKRRLTMIMRGSPQPPLSRVALAALVALGGAVLGFGTSGAQAPGRPVEPAPPTAPAAGPAPVQPAGGRPKPADTRPVPAQAENPGRRPAVPPASREDVLAAEDEVQLLKARLDGRRAEVHEAEALLQLALRKRARFEELAARQAIDQALLEQAATDADVAAARLRGKQAQLVEAELQLRQGERRLAALRDRQAAHTKAAKEPPAVAPRRENTPPPTTKPISAPPARPNAAPQERLQELERKLDDLLRELKDLRKEIRPPSGPSRPGASPPAGAPSASIEVPIDLLDLDELRVLLGRKR